MMTIAVSLKSKEFGFKIPSEIGKMLYEGAAEALNQLGELADSVQEIAFEPIAFGGLNPDIRVTIIVQNGGSPVGEIKVTFQFKPQSFEVLALEIAEKVQAGVREYCRINTAQIKALTAKLPAEK
ncbi:MAG: hypothetical protein WC508_03790 [Patescibacteria group bacterium]